MSSPYFRNALLIALALLVLLAIAGYLYFPQLLQRGVQWLVGLIVVVLGLFLRKKK